MGLKKPAMLDPPSFLIAIFLLPISYAQAADLVSETFGADRHVD
jgi:hypothetical protein